MSWTKYLQEQAACAEEEAFSVEQALPTDPPSVEHVHVVQAHKGVVTGIVVVRLVAVALVVLGS